jgi:hypothetical protein
MGTELNALVRFDKGALWEFAVLHGIGYKSYALATGIGVLQCLVLLLSGMKLVPP